MRLEPTAVVRETCRRRYFPNTPGRQIVVALRFPGLNGRRHRRGKAGPILGTFRDRPALDAKVAEIPSRRLDRSQQDHRIDQRSPNFGPAVRARSRRVIFLGHPTEDLTPSGPSPVQPGLGPPFKRRPEGQPPLFGPFAADMVKPRPDSLVAQAETLALLFCVASKTEWEEVATSATVTTMMIKELIGRDPAGGLYLTKKGRAVLEALL
jgi:hypothetical protein